MQGADFLAAAKDGDVDRLRTLLSAADAASSLVRYRGEGTPDAVVGNTALHWAAAKGHAKCIDALIAAGADTHGRNNGDSTPLQAAVLNGHDECVAALLRARADPTLADEWGDSPLSLAKRAEDTRLIELLSGAAAAGGGGGAPASDAASVDSAAECKRKGNEAFGKKEYGKAVEWYTAALAADDADEPPPAGSSEAEAAAALHSNRSACHAALKDFDAALRDGRAAVSLRPGWAKAHSRIGAALHGLGELDESLRAYQEALACEPANAAALEQLASVKTALRNLKLEALIERGAFNRRAADDAAAASGADGGGGEAAAADGAAKGGKSEKTAEEVTYARTVAEWHGAAKRGETATLERLLGSDPWLLSNRSENTAERLLGNTALHWAAANGRAEAVAWLLTLEGVELDGRNMGGGAPLHSAAAHGRESVVRQLIEAGCDTSLAYENGDT